jgi:hypothetical protein
MVSYFATCGRAVHSGGFVACVQWARERIKTDQAPVKIVRARAGEREGRVVVEVTQEGERTVPDGRRVPVAELRRSAP